MNRYSVFIQADKLKKVIPIPSEFEHQEVEVVISLPERKKIDPRKYRGIFHESKADVDNDLKHMKEEWERNGE